MIGLEQSFVLKVVSAMGERTYLAVDLNNAEKKEMPI